MATRSKYGDVYKDTASSNVVVSRYVELYSDGVFKTYHNFRDEPTNNKSWYLDAECELTPKLATEISQPVALLIRPKGTWTITAKLFESSPRVDLYPFTITWPTSWASNGYTSFTFQLKTIEEAQAWHQAIAESIKSLAKKNGVATSISNAGTSSTAAAPLISTQSMPASPAPGADSISPPTQSAASETVPKPSLATQSMPQVAAATDTDSEPDDDTLHEGGPMPAEGSALDNGKKWRVVTERWVPYKQVNGLAIYHLVEPKDKASAAHLPGLGGEFMVSTVVRGPPSAVLSALLNGSSHTTILGPASVVELLKADTNKEELRLVLEAPGWAGRLCAPREMVVERLLKTDGNMHVVIFSSIDNGSQAAKPVKLSSLYARPVVGMVRGNYIISPLNGHCLDTSPETMITCILKVDLRGACGDRSWLRPFSDLLGWTDAFLDRILMTVILVRDEVEHSRFVLDWQKALSEGQEDESLKASGAPALSRTVSRAQHSSSPSSPRAFRRASSKTAAVTDKMGVISEGDGAEGAAAGAADGPTPEAVPMDMELIKSKATLDAKYWEGIHTEYSKAAPFNVRGPTYLKDRKKVPGGICEFKLASIDMVVVPNAVDHIARFLPSIRQSGAPFSIVINLIIPGSPMLGLVSTFVTDRHPADALGPTAPENPMNGNHDWAPFDFVLHRFLNGTDATRNTMLKLIPHIANGSWVIRQSVGTTPVIIGKALKTSYHQTSQYLEIDIDVSANSTAAYVTGMVRGATTGLIIDMGFVLEGTSPWELPESLLGAMRLNFLDTTKAKTLDMSAEVPLVPALKAEQQ